MGTLLVGIAVLVIAVAALLGSVFSGFMTIFRGGGPGEEPLFTGLMALLLLCVGLALTGFAGVLIGWWTW